MTMEALTVPQTAASGQRSNFRPSPRMVTKRDMYVVYRADISAHANNLNLANMIAAFSIPGTRIAPDLVTKFEPFTISDVSNVSTEADKMNMERASAIKAFKGGVSLMGIGAVAAVAAFAFAAPLLPAASAVFTVAGGLIAAGATERYKRA